MVPEPLPPERPVLRRDEDHRVGPLFFGPGETDLLCGACTFLLVRGANGARSIVDAIIVCPNCDTANQGCAGA